MNSSRNVRAGFIILAAAFAQLAYATNPQPAPKPSPVSEATSSSESHAAALAAAGALSGSVSGAQATGTGGNATSSSAGGRGTGVGVGAAAAGDSSATSNSASGDSVSEANGTQALNNTTIYERQVGTLIMGTVIPVDCGFGGQAGGASTSGSGFLGASWTTDRCYTLKAATAWAAMGQYEYACELLMDVSRKALARRGIASVDCKVVGAALLKQHESQPVVIREQAADPDLSGYATKEYVDKAFRSSVSK